MNNNKRLLLGISLLVMGILLLVGMFRYASFLGFLMIYPYALSQVLGLGLNVYLANVIAVVVGFVLWFAIFRLFLRWNKKKRNLGFALLLGMFALHSLAMFFISGDQLVDRWTGQRKYCTTDSLDGSVHVFERPFYDELGQQAKECTNEQIKKYVQKKRGE
ncbi:hypothetical protein HN858_02180 [Candidatus Falkowbacteria bacterium]|jgi:hypothetical protein|nr:hypothetical protein [Candidatus Falkowbacteria bacterium]MBT6573421.1 hypothetical protein [Candidatus Falkowbacteria bacterium]MBT7348463.1 hypothetical protein [Candidatus Falkowbacteria bacterium]MBT7501193.1 hypothetical protein [Candidatus Falkowbacteria bacterium]